MKAINKNIYIFVLLVILLCLQNNLFAHSGKIPSLHSGSNKHFSEWASFFIMKNQIEIWKDIPGYEGYYQASTQGKMKSLNRIKKSKLGYSFCIKERILKKRIDIKGYKVVILSKNGICKNIKIHRLVALAFIPNPHNYPQINHINGIKSDNRLENLEWCDNSMNQIHAYTNNLQPSRKGINNHFATHTEVEILNIRELYATGKSLTEVAKLCNVGKSTVSAIINRKTWNHI